jgi:hypothetical protein
MKTFILRADDTFAECTVLSVGKTYSWVALHMPDGSESGHVTLEIENQYIFEEENNL